MPPPPASVSCGCALLDHEATASLIKTHFLMGLNRWFQTMKLFPDFIKIKNSFTFQNLVTLEYPLFSLLKIKAFKMCFVSVELEHNNIPQAGKQGEWARVAFCQRHVCGFLCVGLLQNTTLFPWRTSAGIFPGHQGKLLRNRAGPPA